MKDNDSELIRVRERCKNLILKCNTQVDTIKELEKKLEIKEKVIIDLKSDLNKLTEDNRGGCYDKLDNIYRTFFNIISNVIRNDEFIKYTLPPNYCHKYETVYYDKIMDYISNYIDSTLDSNPKMLMELWAEFGLIYRDENDKYIMMFRRNKKNFKTLRVNKRVVNIIKDYMLYD